jgi:phosphomannomutase
MSSSDAREARRCPGERYDITPAICTARQANHYPKCMLCKQRTGQPDEAAASDPKVTPTIFRTTSVAGRVPSEINEYTVRRVGTAAAQYLRAQSPDITNMVVGCDLRESSRNFCRILCEGISLGGLHAVSIGAAAPEVLRFALGSRQFGAGAFVSGCHAAENINGIRLYRANGAPLGFETGLDKIGLIARRLKPGRTRAASHREMLKPVDDYRSYVVKFAGRLTAQKVVLDASCGIAARLIPSVFRRLPVEIVPCHFDAGGRSALLGKRFPSAEVQGAIKKAARSNGARFGAAIDFDGDLIAFYDETGTLVRADVAAALIAGELLNRHPGARVAYDLRFTAAFREDVRRAGGRPLECPANLIALDTAVRQKDVLYAADATGRCFFRDLFGAESPTLALLSMCSLLSRKPEPLSQLAAAVLRYSHSGELSYDMPSAEAAGDAMLELREQFSGAQCELLDGQTVRMENWWFNIRQPGGGALLKLNVEGRTGGETRRGRMSIERVIKKHQRVRQAS